jgi:hypothetical protein
MKQRHTPTVSTFSNLITLLGGFRKTTNDRISPQSDRPTWRRIEISKALVARKTTQVDRPSCRYYWPLNRRVGRTAGEVPSRTSLIEVTIGEVQSSD